MKPFAVGFTVGVAAGTLVDAYTHRQGRRFAECAATGAECAQSAANRAFLARDAFHAAQAIAVVLLVASLTS